MRLRRKQQSSAGQDPATSDATGLSDASEPASEAPRARQHDDQRDEPNGALGSEPQPAPRTRPKRRPGRQSAVPASTPQPPTATAAPSARATPPALATNQRVARTLGVSPLVDEFAAQQPFTLDPFQTESAHHLADGKSVLVAAPTGTGKALEATTPVLTPLGWKPISEICVGDSVIGSQGKPVTVLGVYPQGKRPAYRITFSDGVSVVCDIDHLWAVNTKSRNHDGLPWRVLTLRQILDEGLEDTGGRRHFIPLVRPVTFFQPAAHASNASMAILRQRTGLTQRGLAALLGVSQGFVTQRELGHKFPLEEYRMRVLNVLAEVGERPNLDPYLLGLLLGDGSFSTAVPQFTSADDELIEVVQSLLPRGAMLRQSQNRPYSWFILSSRTQTRNPVVTELLRLGLWGHRAESKFVPHEYKFASIEDRLAILQGLLDSDGSIDGRGLIEYATVSRVLAEDVAFLVRSLGGRTRITEKPTTGQLAYRLNINMPNGASPFRLTRKLARCPSKRKYYPTRSIDAVEPVGEAEMVCISVDAPDGLFVINDFIVTHNTVVAEFAIWLMRRQNQRAIYTAPVKALSNQKFRDLRARHGDEAVGLLTGDIVENPTAPILVMTTEIYRNMLLEGFRAARQIPADTAEPRVEAAPSTRPTGRTHTRGGRAPGEVEALPDERLEAADVAELARRSRLDEDLSGVGCVIFDELHFLSDPERGPVWEEAIIHSPAHVLFVGLSATVTNADELRAWIEQVHGPMALVFHDERAVPLEHYYFLDNTLYLVQNAEGRRVERFPGVGGEAKLARMRNRARRFTFAGDEREVTSRQGAQPGTSGTGVGARATPAGDAEGGAGEDEGPQERQAPEPSEILTALREAQLLPCLYFLPGRKAVETAAMGAAGHLLVSPQQKARLHAEVQEWVRALPSEDQKLDQVHRLAALLPRGLGFHHAGLLPALKVMVETLFARGDLYAVFATDTLALGINMPARCVVVGSLSKFDGTQMRLLTPNEYQQLTGRAGRRGMDVRGSAVIPYSPWDAFEPAFKALTAPLLPVTSAFAIRYNTVLNLWRPHDLTRLRRAVASSLREFQRHGRRQLRGEEWYERTTGGKASKRARDHGLSRRAAEELNAAVYVLRYLDYIGEDDELSVRGRLLRAIFHGSGLIVAELLLSGALDELGPAEVAEVMSWFTYDSDRLRNLQSLSQRMQGVRRALWRVQRNVQTMESDYDLVVSPGIVESFHSVALNWWRGTTLGGLLRKVDLAEGDLLVILNQTIDLLQQVQSAVGQTLDARDLWQAVGRSSREAREAEQLRARLVRLRPVLSAAWHGMLRGSVALSRALPSMTSPALAMAEDEDPAEVRLDRLEAVGAPQREAEPSEPPIP
jgi:ATP-dependent RNA helicase HelY